LSGVPEGASQQQIYCVDADTGTLSWTRSFPYRAFEKHRFNTFASSSPAADSERVYVCWAVPEELNLAALNHEGEVLWRRDLGPFSSQHGHGASPIVHGDLVVLGNDQLGESFLIALDRESGETVWQTPRSSARVSYATPCVFQDGSGRELLIFNSQASGISAIDPANGQVVWSFASAFDKRTVSSPFCGGGLVFGSCGSGGGGNYLVAVAAPSTEDGQPTLSYRLRRSAPYVPTSLVGSNRLFTWSDSGIVSCLRLATGEVLWQERVGGRYFGSPVRIDDRLLAVSDTGEVVIVAAQETFAILARNDLGEPSHATPAVAHGRLYLRTLSTLFCVGAARGG
jgi:outer membrane protein assembly factor BamB